MVGAQAPESILGPRDGARVSRAPAEAKHRSVIPLPTAAPTAVEAV